MLSLYTEDEWQREMSEHSIPELQRTSLTSLVLQLNALGVERVASFEFPSPLPSAHLAAALVELTEMDAIDGRGARSPSFVRQGAIGTAYYAALCSAFTVGGRVFAAGKEALAIVSMLTPKCT